MKRRQSFFNFLVSLILSSLLLNPGVYAMPIGRTPTSFGFLGIEASKTGVSLVWQKESDVPSYIRHLAASSFFVGLTVPEKDWWVNLDLFVSPEDSLGKGLEFTPAGRVLMEADVKLKQYAVRLLSELVADELSEDKEKVSLRFWIEPRDVLLSVDENSLRFNKMRLQVKAEVVGRSEIKELIEARVVPELTKLVNNSPQFEQLRLICKVLFAAWWYKNNLRDGIFKNVINNPSVRLVDETFWTRRGYIAEYMGTFISSKVKDLDFMLISTGGIRVTVDKIGIERKEINGDNNTEQFSPVEFVPVVPIFGDVDMDDVEVVGKTAIVSEYKGNVRLAELLGKNAKIGNEIIFIHPNGKVERIERPQEGERGVFVKGNRAIVINSKGEIKPKDFSGNPEVISFGTSGWRFKVPVKLQGKEKEEARKKLLAKMKAALHGFADYYWDHINSLPDGYKDREGVVIVRDSRYMGDEFLKLAVQVLTSRGIPVYIAKKEAAPTVCPTPVAAFAIDYFKAAFAINFTASHNPVEDNGFKVTPYDGGAAEPEITNEIGMRINERLLGLRPIEESPMRQDLVKEFYMTDLLTHYTSYIEKELIDVLGQDLYDELVESIGEKDGITTIITSALHGSAGRVLRKISHDLGFMSFGGNFIVEDEKPDSLFGGLKAPEPSKEMLGKEKITEKGRVGIGLIDRIKDLEGAGVAFVPDGDADRFAVIDSKGNYISPNQLMGILVEFLNKYGKKKGGIVKTVPSSDFALAVARRWNQPGEEMKVGFKWAKQFWNRDDIAVVGEESAHIGLTGTKTWDDGLLMGILGVLMEVYYRKYEGKSLSDVVRELEKEVGYYRYKRVNVPLTADLKKSLKGLFDVLYSQKGGETVARNDLNNLSGLDWNAIEKAYGKKIEKVVLLDGVKIVFEDNGWFAVRLSGTEPVARLYVEGVDKNEETAMRKREMLERVGKEFLDGKFLSIKKDDSSGQKMRDYKVDKKSETSSFTSLLGPVFEGLDRIKMYIDGMRKFDTKEWDDLIHLIDELGYTEVAHLLAIDLFMEGLIDTVPVKGVLKWSLDEDISMLTNIYDLLKKLIKEKDLPEFIEETLLDRIERMSFVPLDQMEEVQEGLGLLWRDKVTSEIRLGVKQGKYVLLVGDPLDEKDIQDTFKILDGEMESVLGDTIWSSVRSLGVSFDLDRVFGPYRERLNKEELADLLLLYLGKTLRQLNISNSVVDRLALLASMRSPHLTSVVSYKLRQLTAYSKDRNVREKAERNVGGILLYRVIVF